MKCIKKSIKIVHDIRYCNVKGFSARVFYSCYCILQFALLGVAVALTETSVQHLHVLYIFTFIPLYCSKKCKG